MPNFPPPPPPITLEINDKKHELKTDLFTLDMSYKYSINSLTIEKNLTLIELHSYLDKLSNLKENWDGYNATTISKNIIKIAKNLLLKLPNISLDLLEKDSISPNANGTISIEWEQNEDTKLFLEIGESYSSYFMTRKDRTPKIVNKLPLSRKIVPSQLVQDLRFVL